MSRYSYQFAAPIASGWLNLPRSNARVAALANDIVDLSYDLDSTIEEASRELLRRIGGRENLRPYVDSLVAGHPARPGEDNE